MAHMDPEADDKGSNKEALAITRSMLDSATVFASIVWASNHYVLVFGQRSSSWSFSYQDSLHQPMESCRRATENMMRNLALLSPLQNLPASAPGQQNDAWSCGLWSLRNLEMALRRHRQEIMTCPPSIEFVRTRLNAHISKFKPGVPLPKAPARGKAKLRQAEPATLEEALQRGQECTKCHATKRFTKGCTTCTGRWLEQIRVRR